jgi:DNA mismatch repair ATPase MutS
MLEIETRVFGELAAFLASEATRLAEVARTIGEIDLFAALAEGAATRGYVRPRIAAERVIRVVEGRHPVVERVRRDDPFVPIDVALDDRSRVVILTGPNMGGKSTYLRQTAIIALMARAAFFVPAREAEIGPIDRIFTRVGASDHLARGESTFMVEMIEAANILRNASPESLVILDEVGRGTSTFDGLSLAWAIVEHLRDEPARRAFTLFATHYHEMTELAKTSEGVANFTMAVREWEEGDLPAQGDSRRRGPVLRHPRRRARRAPRAGHFPRPRDPREPRGSRSSTCGDSRNSRARKARCRGKGSSRSFPARKARPRSCAKSRSASSRPSPRFRSGHAQDRVR